MKQIPVTTYIVQVGDWGRLGEFNQSLVAEAMASRANKLRPDFVLGMGDNFYPSKQPKFPLYNEHWALATHLQQICILKASYASAPDVSLHYHIPHYAPADVQHTVQSEMYCQAIVLVQAETSKLQFACIRPITVNLSLANSILRRIKGAPAADPGALHCIICDT